MAKDHSFVLEQDFIAVPEKFNAEFDGHDGHGYEEGLPAPEAICIAALRAKGYEVITNV